MGSTHAGRASWPWVELSCVLLSPPSHPGSALWAFPERNNDTIASVSPFHPTLPLFASASDDTAVHVYHGRVFSDLMQNALIVPVKILRGHKAKQHVGLMACAFHPTWPWLFSAGADGEIVLWTAL